MKPAHVSAMFLYLFAVQAEHRKSAREIKMAHADARRTPALNLGQTIAIAARLHVRTPSAVMGSFRSAARTGIIATV
ncbi:hypothetical protein KXX11_001037, partial [Aspergillus fumigatus]